MDMVYLSNDGSQQFNDVRELFKSETPLFVTAPMINQSDLPFRVLTRRYNANLTYTQMLKPNRLLYDQEYREHHINNMNPQYQVSTDWATTKDADLTLAKPVVAQVCGNDVQEIVEASKKIAGFCDAIDLNLGCPLESARDEHFGSYLLGQHDWPLVENIVSALSHTFPIPISTKLRLCNPAALTLPFATRLAHAGSSWIALHARFGQAPRKRRHGPADLDQVRILKAGIDVPVVSNGNVRCYEDIVNNLGTTGADGVMVGETLLGNPGLFKNTVPDPVTVSLEYMDICRACPAGVVELGIVRQHLKHIFNYHCSRRTWISKFHNSLASCKSLDDIDRLLRIKVQRWRGKPFIPDIDCEDHVEEHSEDDTDGNDIDSHLDGLHLLS